MPIRLSVIDDVNGLHAIESRWQELADSSHSAVGSGGLEALFLGPRWQLAWWRAYHRQLAAELYSILVQEDERIIGLAPFYKRVAKDASAVRVREIRLLGDAGPRPPALDILAEPGHESTVGTALADFLGECASEWDTLDLQPLREPSRARAYMASRLSALGRPLLSAQAGGAVRIELNAIGVHGGGESSNADVLVYTGDLEAMRKGMSALRRLSRLEWTDRDEASPFADREATHLLEDVTFPLGKVGKARLTRLNDPEGEAIAALLSVDELDRAVVLAMAIDPEWAEGAARILGVEAEAAAARGCRSLDINVGGGHYDLPNLPTTFRGAVHLRAFGSSKAAALARTYGRVRRHVEAAIDAPGAAAAGARAAWSKIRTAAAQVAGYERMHLYRGELWTRGIKPTAGLSLQLFVEADFDALDAAERNLLFESLDMDEGKLRAIWQEGDIAVLARINGRPAGIAWCSQGLVVVPELDRRMQLGPGEAYIHDVFVAPQARGRSVAPSMLEFFAHELRQRDLYRSWALIASDNVASIRAFEKAAYAAVADVIYARMAAVDKLVVRPPDPEAKKLLGL